MSSSDKTYSQTDTLKGVIHEFITELAVISTKLDKVIDELGEVKSEMKLKVNSSDFIEVKKEIEELKKHKWTSIGFAGAVSFFISHFLR